MLMIEVSGAQRLIDYLKKPHTETTDDGTELHQILEANRFFVDYYRQWSGVNPENLAEALACVSQAEWQPATPVLAALCRGFRQAIQEIELLQRKLDFLKGVDPSGLTYRTLAHLPSGTPMDSVIHLTIDSFNSGFQYQGEIGLSLLQDVTNPDSFGSIVSHELHHAGFRYWAERDPIRQAILSESSGRSVAMQHVQNLLAEGMATFYCSPIPIDRQKMPAALANKLEKFQREDRPLLAQAGRILTIALAPGADFTVCQGAYDTLAIDPEGIQPAGHYIGSRMLEIMSQTQPHDLIVECVRSLKDFLPLYNQAAEQAGMPIFDPAAVAQFSQLWEHSKMMP
jgi:hypothetical protein